MTIKGFFKDMWVFCRFVFVLQRRSKDDRRGDRLWRAAGLSGVRKALWHDSDTVPAAGMMLNDTYL